MSSASNTCRRTDIKALSEVLTHAGITLSSYKTDPPRGGSGRPRGIEAYNPPVY